MNFVHSFKFQQCKLNHVRDLEGCLFFSIGLLVIKIQFDNLGQIFWIADTAGRKVKKGHARKDT